MKGLSTLALGLVLCAVWAPAVFAQGGTSEEPVLVGRVTLIEGQLLRYIYAEQDWVATVKDAPFGLDDAVYSDDTGKAEFKLPNGVWVRAGSDTQIQLLALREDLTEIDVASGTVRFYNKSQKAVVKATTPFGYVLAKPGCAFDLYVGDESAEVISLNGSVDFVIGEGESRYVVVAGERSIISDGRVAAEGDGQVNADWDEWNLKREELWTQRVQVKGESVDNLPLELHEDAYELDQSGRWEQVYYDGRYRKLWRPTAVSAGWQPFMDGRWTVWHKDNVWIPGESFGYVTHHYGNWVLVNSSWYWAPPAEVKAGSIDRNAYWYPGRVSWVHSDSNVGWVPLAPRETYYSHNYWGPATVEIGERREEIGVDRLAYAGSAVVVARGSLYSVNSYSGVRVPNIQRTTIITNYRAAPVMSDRVIPNYNAIRNRYVYNTNLALLAAKPHEAVEARIKRNLAIASQMRGGMSGLAVQQNTARIGRGELVKSQQDVQRIRRELRITGRLVPANMVHRPRSEVQFIQRSLKMQEKRPQGLPGFQRPGAQPRGAWSPRAAAGVTIRPAERVNHGKNIGPGVHSRQTANERRLRQQGRRWQGRRQGPGTRSRQIMQRQQQGGLKMPQSFQRSPQRQSHRSDKMRLRPAGQRLRSGPGAGRRGFQSHARGA